MLCAQIPGYPKQIIAFHCHDTARKEGLSPMGHGGTLVEPCLRAAPDHPGAYLGKLSAVRHQTRCVLAGLSGSLGLDLHCLQLNWRICMQVQSTQCPALTSNALKPLVKRFSMDPQPRAFASGKPRNELNWPKWVWLKIQDPEDRRSEVDFVPSTRVPVWADSYFVSHTQMAVGPLWFDFDPQPNRFCLFLTGPGPACVVVVVGVGARPLEVQQSSLPGRWVPRMGGSCMGAGSKNRIPKQSLSFFPFPSKDRIYVHMYFLYTYTHIKTRKEPNCVGAPM